MHDRATAAAAYQLAMLQRDALDFGPTQLRDHRTKLSAVRACDAVNLFHDHAHRSHACTQTFDDRASVGIAEPFGRNVPHADDFEILLDHLRLANGEARLEHRIEASYLSPV